MLVGRFRQVRKVRVERRLFLQDGLKDFERIELIHRATNRDVFARGALHAAARLAGREPGSYQLRDLFVL